MESYRILRGKRQRRRKVKLRVPTGNVQAEAAALSCRTSKGNGIERCWMWHVARVRHGTKNKRIY